MVNDTTKQKRSPLFYCGCGCLASPFIGILLFFITYHVSAWLTESTLFLETENITLVKTCDINSFQNDPRTECFYDEVNRTSVNPRSQNDTIILTENDDFFVLAEERWVRACFISPRFPKDKFENNASFSFYHIHKDIRDGKPYVVKTEFLGSIKTNLYGAWNMRGRGKHRISISPDGKYIVMSAGTVDSRSLGEFRNKAVLLIWEVGDKVEEKDILTKYYGKKMSIIIKTEEELAEELAKEKEEEEKKLDEEYLKFAQDFKPSDSLDSVRNLTATPLDSTSIKLTWDRARGADYYQIFQWKKAESNIPNYNFAPTATTGFSPREYIATGLSPDTTYCFRISPINSMKGRGTISGPTQSTQATTLP